MTAEPENKIPRGRHHRRDDLDRKTKHIDLSPGRDLGQIY
jgi:hypothetical protein